MDNSVSNKDIWSLIDLKFNTKNVLYDMHYLSYQQFIEDNIISELNKKYVIHENIIGKQMFRYSLKFDNIMLKAPSDEFDYDTITPNDARIRHINYSSKLFVDIKQIQEIINFESNTVDEKVLYHEKKINIGAIPIMVRSKYCTTNIKKDVPNLECPYDPGCYFIIKGLEKVVVSHERICENKELIFPKKDINFADGIMYSVQVNSKAQDSTNINITSIKMLKDKSIILTMPHFSEIPICIIFRVLGFESDQEIINYIVYDNTDTNMINMMNQSFTNSYLETYKDDNGEDHVIMTKEDAENYLIQKMKTSRKYNETDSEIRHMQKREHLLSILENELFSHMEKGMTEKGYYLGMMCNKLLQCILKKIEPDDRDNFINKRIDLPGTLMARLFEQYLKKMINECSKNFKKRMGGLTTDVNPSNIIGLIKSMTIEQGFSTALATGNWGSNKKKGVAQPLHRHNYSNTVSYFRRIITPSPDASTSKMDKMRHIHSGQYGFIDPVESPDGEKIGIQKHLALSASVTINSKEQIKIIKDLLDDKPEIFTYLTDVPSFKIKINTKVFISGQWYGMTDKPIQLVEYLRTMRSKGVIVKMVGIAHNYKMKEIRINTDGGRLFRPLLKVKNNKLLLTKEMLNEIDLNMNMNSKKISTWNDFISKYNDVIEYVDCEESENLMIAMTTHILNEERNKMLNTVVSDKNSNISFATNRYNNVYRRFTHCELNPAMMLGTVSSNIPFSEHNQSPRNIYNFSQARQAMGIHVSSLRHRIDLTYQLFHPQIPIVHTRMAKYTNMLNLPSGENIIVAIACYTGYNQEDSIIINRSSVDRGLLRAAYFTKYHDVIQKNPSTSRDDIFMKPDPNQTMGIQYGNYDKLNDKGFIEEETRVDPGDFIIGKVSQIQPDKNNSNKIYKDSSTKYKSGVAGVIDKVYTGIYNTDNFEMYNVKVRSERIPRVGDKLCSRHGQKGSVGISLPTEDMPFTKDGIQPDIIINPCCFTGETLISMSNGLSKKINSFSSQGLEKVLTFNDKTGFVPSFSLGLENRGIKDTVNITMYDGRTITCTPDHKIKVKSIGGFEYKEAKDIKINEDNVIMGIEYTEDKVFDDEKDWSLKVGEYEFNFNDNFNREKSLAFARVLGYLSTDGTICCSNNTYVGRINMGHILDAEGIVNDIEIITNKSPKISQDHLTYNINIPSELINNIVKLEGLMTGRRTTQEASLPKFLFEENCSKAIIREFLGSFFGGDSHSPYITDKLFSKIRLSQSIIVKYKKSLENKMNNIIRLMNKLDVKAKIIRTRDCHKKTELYQTEPRVQCEIGVESNIEFLQNIGLRHCLEKSARLTIAVSYERFYNNVLKQTKNLLNKIDDIINNEHIQIKDALEKARNELYSTDKPLDSFYSTLDLTYVNNKRRQDRKDKPIVFKHDRFYTAEEYIKQLGCEEWFSRQEDGKMNYIVKRENNYIPYFTMKVNNITDAGQNEVYDIGVSTHHNFIAEGLAVSNCIPSRMTIGQLFECVLGKASALSGHLSDATPFENFDIEEAKKVLKENGFEEHGNETLYCGFTGKKMESQIFIGPTYYFRLKHMVLDKIHCLTAEHDVLTTEGWIPINEVKENHKVATLDNNKLVYVNPIKVLHFDDYEGKMYKIKNQAIDLDVTLNHRMYIKTCHTRKQVWSDYKLEPAENIVGKMVKYKKDAEWNISDYQFILPKVKSHNGDYEEKFVDMNSWITFFGIWIAEGWTTFCDKSRHYTIEFAVNKQRVKEALYPAINKLGFHYYVNNEKLRINNKQLYNYMQEFSIGAPNKYLPLWVWELSKIQAQKLIHAMQLGDGTFSKRTCSTMYYTSSNKLADDFMRLCLHAGWSGMKSVHIKAGTVNYIKGREIITKNDIWRISVITTRNEPCVNHGHHKEQNIQVEEVYDYKGPVYCLQVPSEIFMVRKNGKSVWTGNSRSRGPTAILTRQPTEGRAREGGLRFGEMERDAMISHGLSQFLKERFMETSDPYIVHVCDNCGLFARKVIDSNHYICDSCRETKKISTVSLPYAFKLMVQELLAINIMPRIRAS